jgi:transcriptional regulator with XRE-family HTH domain
VLAAAAMLRGRFMNPNLIRELRRASNLSQIELSNKSGVSRFRIQLAESGTLELRPTELLAIREAVRPALARAAELLTTELVPMSDSIQTPSGEEAHLAPSIGNKESKS